LYRELYQENYGVVAPPVPANIFTIYDKDPGREKDMTYKYIGDYWEFAMRHYEVKGEYFDDIKGYEHYAQSSVAMRADADRVTE